MKLGDPIYMVDAEENGHTVVPDMYDRKWTAKTSYPIGAPATCLMRSTFEVSSPLIASPHMCAQRPESYLILLHTSSTAGLAVYVLILAVAGFAEGVRGLPWWYQLLVAASAIATPALLYVVNQTDPGIIPCSATKGALCPAHMQRSTCMRPCIQHLCRCHACRSARMPAMTDI